MKKKTKDYTFGVLLVLGIFFFWIGFSVGYLKPQEENIEPPKAILHSEIYDFAINFYDNNEMFFDYWIYNFGEVEAKNIKVTCKLLDKNYNLVETIKGSYGNLASNSAELGEVLGDNKIIEEEEYTAMCYIESCDNCEILYKNIPGLVESFERE